MGAEKAVTCDYDTACALTLATCASLLAQNTPRQLGLISNHASQRSTDMKAFTEKAQRCLRLWSQESSEVRALVVQIRQRQRHGSSEVRLRDKGTIWENKAIARQQGQSPIWWTWENDGGRSTGRFWVEKMLLVSKLKILSLDSNRIHN